MLPTVTRGSELKDALADAALWPRVARTIAARHGVSLEGLIQPPSSFPVLVHRRHVVKLVPDHWKSKLEAERAMLEAARGHLPVPEVVAEGRLETWSYLVMTRLTGRAASQVFPTASDDARRAVMRAIGELVARLHELPVPRELAHDWAAFVREGVASAAERHARGGAEPALTSAIGARLAAAADELASPARVVPLHADVHADHVLLDDALHITGLLDFGDALAGDPAYELVTPATFLARGRPALLAALLEGYGSAPSPELRRRCVAYQLLHRFSDLKRDLGLVLAEQAPGEHGSLDAALDALWPQSAFK